MQHFFSASKFVQISTNIKNCNDFRMFGFTGLTNKNLGHYFWYCICKSLNMRKLSVERKNKKRKLRYDPGTFVTSRNFRIVVGQKVHRPKIPCALWKMVAFLFGFLQKVRQAVCARRKPRRFSRKAWGKEAETIPDQAGGGGRPDLLRNCRGRKGSK